MRIRAQILHDSNLFYIVFELSAYCRLATEESSPHSVYELMTGLHKLIRQNVSVFKVAGNLAFTTHDATSSEQAMKFTAFAGLNNDFVVYAKPIGAAGTVIRIRLILGAGLLVSVAGNDITVELSNPIVETANQVIAAINVHPDASALVHAVLCEGNDGTGVVAALAWSNLASSHIFAPALEKFCARQGRDLYLYVMPHSTAANGTAYQTQLTAIDNELNTYLGQYSTSPNALAEAFRGFSNELFIENDGIWANWFDPRPTAPTWTVRP